MRTMTRERIAAMAPVALTYPGSEVVTVRMQTGHLYAARHFRSTPGSLR